MSGETNPELVTTTSRNLGTGADPQRLFAVAEVDHGVVAVELDHLNGCILTVCQPELFRSKQDVDVTRAINFEWDRPERRVRRLA